MARPSRPRRRYGSACAKWASPPPARIAPIRDITTCWSTPSCRRSTSRFPTTSITSTSAPARPRPRSRSSRDRTRCSCCWGTRITSRITRRSCRRVLRWWWRREPARRPRPRPRCAGASGCRPIPRRRSAWWSSSGAAVPPTALIIPATAPITAISATGPTDAPAGSGPDDTLGRTAPPPPDFVSARRLRCAQALAIQPLRDHAGDRRVVLLDHHHVAVAEHADIGKADERVGHARLAQIVRRAVIIRGVIGRLRHDDDHRNALEVRQLARGRLLQPAAHQVGLVSLVLAHE